MRWTRQTTAIGELVEYRAEVGHGIVAFKAGRKAWSYIIQTSTTVSEQTAEEVIEAYAHAGQQQHDYAGGFDEATLTLEAGTKLCSLCKAGMGPEECGDEDPESRVCDICVRTGSPQAATFARAEYLLDATADEYGAPDSEFCEAAFRWLLTVSDDTSHAISKLAAELSDDHEATTLAAALQIMMYG